MPQAVIHSRSVMRSWSKCFIQTRLWPQTSLMGKHQVVRHEMHGQSEGSKHNVTETQCDLSLRTGALPLRYAAYDVFCYRRKGCFMIRAQSHCHRATLSKHGMLGNREVITTAILWVSNGCPQRQQDSLCESLESQHYCQLETTAP